MITYLEIGPNNMLMKAQRHSKESAVWLDVFQPTPEERQRLLDDYNIVLPLHNEMHQIEFSNRFYYENDALYLSVTVITQAAPLPESHVITFVLTKNRLFTLRYSNPNPIEIFINQLDVRKNYATDSFSVFLLLLSKIVGSIADVFELIEDQSEDLSLKLVGSTDSLLKNKQSKFLNKTLREINYLQCLLGKCYQSLASLTLLIAFFDEVQQDMFSKDELAKFQTISQDIDDLTKHGDHLTQKFNFQLQSTLGLINIEQTQIIKIFTVLGMVFMPPTLVASIYGMNFHDIPELSWKYGYEYGLILMLSTALLPYLFFKRKGWI